MKRAFVCAHADFPRCGAGANYVYNLAKCLQAIGYTAVIIARGSNREEDWNEEKRQYIYNGIEYKNVERKTGKIRNYFYEGSQAVTILEEYNVASADCIFMFSVNFFYISRIYRIAKTKKTNFCACAVEHFQPFQYKGQWMNPVFWLDRIGIRFGIPIGKQVIVISRYLQDYFNKLGCKTFLLPPLVDFNEYQVNRAIDSQSKVCNIIYSGNPSGKDDMDVMMRSILNVSREGTYKIKFHVTGCAKEKVMRICSLSIYEWQELSQVVCFYSWMDYDKLINLYREMDFFLLARHVNKVTLANFPSKVPELMTYGIIPIVCDAGDYTELYIRNCVNGIVFANCEVDECTRAIEKAVSLDSKDKELLSHNAQMLVKNKFDYHVWGKAMKDFLNE